MYVNDPNEKAMLPEIEELVDLEEPRDYHEFFYDDQPLGSNKRAEGYGYQIDHCRFTSDGDHIPGRYCPHYDLEDEEGKRILPGWTVQKSYG